MSTVSFNCTCGQRPAIPVGDVDVLRNHIRGTPYTLRLTCPDCGRVSYQKVSASFGLKLVGRGAPLGEYVPHPEKADGGPALTEDDLLDFCAALHSPRFTALAAMELGAT